MGGGYGARLCVARSDGLGWTLIALSIIDARTFLLPDCLTLPLIAAGVGHSAWINTPSGSPFGHYCLEAAWSLAAAAAGFLVMALVAGIFRRIRGIEGLGLGDAKLFAAAGAWLGMTALPSIMLVAAMTAWSQSWRQTQHVEERGSREPLHTAHTLRTVPGGCDLDCRALRPAVLQVAASRPPFRKANCRGASRARATPTRRRSPPSR